MEADAKKVIEHDIRGQICPATLLIALKSMNANRDGLKRGDVELVFLTDSRDATLTIPDAAINMGYIANVAKQQDCYRITIEAPESAVQ